MFGFGWVRTDLGVVLNDSFGLFFRFLEKWTKSAKSGQIRGPTPRRREPNVEA